MRLCVLTLAICFGCGSTTTTAPDAKSLDVTQVYTYGYAGPVAGQTVVFHYEDDTFVLKETGSDGVAKEGAGVVAVSIIDYGEDGAPDRVDTYVGRSLDIQHRAQQRESLGTLSVTVEEGPSGAMTYDVRGNCIGNAIGLALGESYSRDFSASCLSEQGGILLFSTAVDAAGEIVGYSYYDGDPARQTIEFTEWENEFRSVEAVATSEVPTDVIVFLAHSHEPVLIYAGEDGVASFDRVPRGDVVALMVQVYEYDGQRSEAYQWLAMSEDRIVNSDTYENQALRSLNFADQVVSWQDNANQPPAQVEVSLRYDGGLHVITADEPEGSQLVVPLLPSPIRAHLGEWRNGVFYKHLRCGDRLPSGRCVLMSGGSTNIYGRIAP